MANGDVLKIVAGVYTNVPVATAISGATPVAANVPAESTGTLVLLSDAITALTALRASHNDLLAKMKAAGLMVPD